MLLQLKKYGVIKNDEFRKIERYFTLLNGFHFDYLVGELARKGATPYCNLERLNEFCSNHYRLVYLSIKDRLMITFNEGDVTFVYFKTNYALVDELKSTRRLYQGQAV